MTKMERIQKLLDELRYEVEVGILQGEVEEEFGYQFVVQISRKMKRGVVVCRFQTKVEPWYCADPREPMLKVVK